MSPRQEGQVFSRDAQFDEQEWKYTRQWFFSEASEIEMDDVTQPELIKELKLLQDHKGQQEHGSSLTTMTKKVAVP